MRRKTNLSVGIIPNRVEVAKEDVTKKPVVRIALHETYSTESLTEVNNVGRGRNFKVGCANEYVEALVLGQITSGIGPAPTLLTVLSLENHVHHCSVELMRDEHQGQAGVKNGVRCILNVISRGPTMLKVVFCSIPEPVNIDFPSWRACNKVNPGQICGVLQVVSIVATHLEGALLGIVSEIEGKLSTSSRSCLIHLEIEHIVLLAGCPC